MVSFVITFIMNTSPCNEDPLTHHFYKVKLGLTGVCIFEQKYENEQNISNENCHFYTREKSLYVTWACFRNVNTPIQCTAI